MKISCIIIDDEHLARQYIKEYIQKIPFLHFVGEFNSPLKATELIKQGDIDLLFLDIQMPDITGLDFLRTIHSPPYVILTTAYKEYAIEGYELNVCDYLLKPFSFERFFSAVNKVLEQKEKDVVLNSGQDNTEARAILHNNYLVIRADRKFYKINYEDIVFIEGQKAYVTFHTLSRKITALASLKELEEKLPEDFIRIHKSFIVSIQKLDALEGNQVEIGGELLPVGKSYRKAVCRIFGMDE